MRGENQKKGRKSEEEEENQGKKERNGVCRVETIYTVCVLKHLSCRF